MKAGIANWIYYPIQWLRREPVLECLGRLEETQWYAREQLEKWQWECLRTAVFNAVASTGSLG